MASGARAGDAASPTRRSASRPRIDASGVTGIVKPAPGNPNDLLMHGLAAATRSTQGRPSWSPRDRSSAANLPSLFPPGHPDRAVTASTTPGTDTQQVHIKPFADLRRPRLRPGPDRAHGTAAGRRARGPSRSSLRLAALGARRCRAPAHVRRAAAHLRRHRRPARRSPWRPSGCSCGSVTGAVVRLLHRADHRLGAAADHGPDVAGPRRVGYWRRAPARAARPAGRARADAPSAPRPRRSSTIGYGAAQFLLGVDAPAQLAAARADPRRPSSLDTLLALPVYALVRRWLLPALPEDPRRRRRRAPTRPAACRR